MTATDLAADLLSTAEDDEEEPDPEVETPIERLTCEFVLGDGSICGSPQENKRNLNAHMMSVHKVTLAGNPVAARGTSTKGKGNQDKPPDREKKPSASQTKAPSPAQQTDRAKLYAKSIATYALLLHVAAGRAFDDYDLRVVSSTAPQLGSGLAGVGDKHKGVQQVCDLIFLGGEGGPYVELVMALAMTFGPIMSHHGYLPPVVGERLGAMIGAIAPEPGPVQTPTVVKDDETPAPGRYFDPATATLDEWMTIMTSMPQNIAVDMAQMMMAGNPATVTTIPAMPGTEPNMQIAEEHHRGSNTAGATEDSESLPA